MNIQTSPDFLSMSDDEISNMSAPPAGVAEPVVVPEPEEPLATTPEPQEPAKEPVVTEPAVTEPVIPEKAPVEDDKTLAAPDGEKIEPPVPAKKPETQVTEPAKTEPEKPTTEPEKPVEEPVAKVLTVEEKAQALDSLMTFKANGREIKLNSPAELLQLAQMGANYTKKMQKLQPAMRLITMLENNKLSDPAELSYLIDLHQKKPEAIQKLLADSKFDPNEVDVEKAAQYKPGAHQVSDVEVEFKNVLEEVESSTTGQELLVEVTRQWDEGSRRALFQQPKLLSELNVQKSLGIYGQITNEMERRHTLGDLQNVPFLVAYEAVGKDLYQKGLLKFPDQIAETAPVVTEPVKPQPVAVRTVVPAPQVTNNDKAAAVSTPKTTAATVKTEPDYLTMPDEEFLKQFQGRL